MNNGVFEGRVQDGFDGFQYLASYDDLIAALGPNEHAAAAHFVTYGFSESRPRDSFDGMQYVASYGDLIEAFGANERAAAAHFVTYGLAEGRTRDSFDAAQYLANYVDLREAYGEDQQAATLHYINFGYFEGRNDNAPGGSSSIETLSAIDHGFTTASALAASNDHFVFDMLGADELTLDDAIFAAIGSTFDANAFAVGHAAAHADHRIVYDQPTSQLFHEADGSGGNAAVLFANLFGSPSLTVNDFTVI